MNEIRTCPKLSADRTARESILDAAVLLFARSGYHGTTTKQISQEAKVSEGNIYRYFQAKRDLFIAAVQSELSSAFADAIDMAQIESVAEDVRALQYELFRVAAKRILARPQLVRLVQFSALEFGPEFCALFSNYFQPLIDSTVSILGARYPERSFAKVNLTLVVLCFISAIISVQDICTAWGSCFPLGSPEEVSICVELLCRMFSTLGQSDLPADVQDLSHSLNDL